MTHALLFLLSALINADQLELRLTSTNADQASATSFRAACPAIYLQTAVTSPSNDCGRHCYYLFFFFPTYFGWLRIAFFNMSSHVVVIATDLRRATVKVTPLTYMIDVLDEACRKLNLTSDKYLLK